MNQTLLTILIFAFLVLFIVSPFAGLAGLMIMLLIAAFFFLVANVFQAIIGSDPNPREP
ncbi:hypothetical protein I8751_26945 [Nostocaceae cyanobacterium CENA357]|uniref:Uncharacterized protein n=1 Tax=Atlanticothrix silvestris CENA357 TaxID=1725252 RepID=A0A8J7HNY5_9CYAN|nr:hypothetical protein [Atlanticothrix silvestris]MBH8555915.1 hypothetical protein [Atlanticothrix silvestris CENA357]